MTDLHTATQSPDDVQPWYRQFWPWFIMFLPACAVVASLWTLFIAIEGSDDLVVDNYYTDGLAINLQLEKRNFALQNGISAGIQLDGDQILITLSGPVQAQQLTLQVSHPMEADQDFNATLIAASPGHYRGRLPRIPAERWHWVLDAGPDSRWRLDGKFSAENFIVSSASKEHLTY
ncbi:MAG: FixH family protein [Parahaliea sp.]